MWISWHSYVFLLGLDCTLVDDILYLFSKCEIKRDLCSL